MVKLGSKKTIGTPVRCPSCRHANLAIDIWCARCGAPLDWNRTIVLVEAPPAPRPRALEPPRRKARGWRIPRLGLPASVLPRFTRPRWMTGPWTMPRFVLPRIEMPRLRPLIVPRLVWVVALVLAVLLIVPLVYVFLPSSRSVAARHATATQLPATNAGTAKGGSPQSAAIAALAAKTGLKYSSQCPGTAACLSIAGQTIGKDAAAIVFVTAHSGGRQCVAYVYQKGGGWHLQDAACALPGQVSPLVGHDATVHVAGNCANARGGASLQAGVVSCLKDGTTVHVDGGPVYVDDFIWWHTSKGWMAHDFLVAP